MIYRIRIEMNNNIDLSAFHPADESFQLLRDRQRKHGYSILHAAVKLRISQVFIEIIDGSVDFFRKH